MASDKSFAAEIEANGMNLEQALAYLKPADANNGTISLRAPKAREAVAVIVAEIAALQSRAFEGGARKGLSDALAAYDAAERELTAAEAVHQDVCRRIGDEPDIGEIMQRVGAEQACMRCSMAKGIARGHLVAAVRAVLQPEGERSDA